MLIKELPDKSTNTYWPYVSNIDIILEAVFVCTVKSIRLFKNFFRTNIHKVIM